MHVLLLACPIAKVAAADLPLAHRTLRALATSALNILQRDHILIVSMHGLPVLVLSGALVPFLAVAPVVDVGVTVAGVGLAADEGVQAV